MGGGGSSLTQALSDPNNQKVFESTFKKYDKNKGGSLDTNELCLFVNDYFTSLSTDPTLNTLPLLDLTPPESRHEEPIKANTFAFWGKLKKQHPNCSGAIMMYVSKALIGVLDTDKNGSVSFDEWKACEWSQLIPKIQAQMKVLDKQEFSAIGKRLDTTCWLFSKRCAVLKPKGIKPAWSGVPLFKLDKDGDVIITLACDKLQKVPALRNFDGMVGAGSSFAEYSLVDGKIKSDHTFIVNLKDTKSGKILSFSGRAGFIIYSDAASMTSWTMRGETTLGGESSGYLNWEFEEDRT